MSGFVGTRTPMQHTYCTPTSWSDALPGDLQQFRFGLRGKETGKMIRKQAEGAVQDIWHAELLAI